MLRAAWKSILARKLRLALTALAVVLGVGFTAGTFVLTDTLNRTFSDLFANAYAGTDVVIQAKTTFTPGPGSEGGGFGPQGNPLPESLLNKVREVQGVRAADGDVAGYAQLIDPKTGKAIGNGGAPTFGNSWDPNTTTFTLRTGGAPTEPGQIAIDAATASKYSLTVGQSVKVITVSGTSPYTITGIVGFGTADNLGGATVTIFSLPTAQQLFGRVGTLDQIYVTADTGVPAATLRDRISPILPAGFQAVLASDVAKKNSDELQQNLSFLQTFLLVFALISVFVGAFIILNTFTILIAQRTRELGLLRALGASRTQVLSSVLAEAVVVGLSASVVGIGFGVVVAQGLRGLLSLLGGSLPSTTTQILPRTIVVSLVLGTVVTVVASVMPAIRASRVSPIEALREETGAARKTSARRLVVGSILSVFGLALISVGLFGHVSNAGALVGVGAAITFVGVAWWSPVISSPVSRAVTAPFAGGISGRLARENAKRNPRRTASTASALMIGLGLIAMVSVLSASLKASASSAIDRTLKADFILTGSNFTPFSPHLAQVMSSLPQLQAVSEFRTGPVRVLGGSQQISGIDPSTFGEVADLPMSAGSVEVLSQPGSILIYKDVASSHHLSVGQTIKVEFQRTGWQMFTVAGIYTDNTLINNYAISLSSYDANFTEPLDFAAYAKAAPNATVAQARAAIDAAAKDYPNVQVQDQSQFKQQQSSAIDKFLGLVSALLLLAVIIALFGIANTLGLSIYERVREIGLLRAVGMTRTQVKAMIRIESVTISVFGAFLGMSVGVLFGVAIQRAARTSGVTELVIPVGSLIFYLIISAVLGVIAAIFPARRAARLDILHAITYE